MYDERLNKIIEENPSLEWLNEVEKNNGIVVISPNVEKYENDSNQLKMKYSSISRQLIVDIFTHDDSFNKLKKLYENNLYSIQILFIGEKGEYKDQYNLTKFEIVDALKQINPQEIPSVSDRYYQVMDYVSYEKYKERTKDNIYEITIDGKNYQIPVKLIYQFLDLDNESINKIIETNKPFTNMMPLSHFLYALNKYFKDKKILENYLVEERLKERLKKIMSSEKVDVQMLNEYLNTDDSLLEQVKVNNDLQNLIFSGIPPEFNDLEKAIYIYIKMCKILTYDDEYYAVNQKGPLANKHKIIDNIFNVSKDNNKIVCYEFDAIYSYFLHKLGINYKHFVLSDGKDDEFDDDIYNYSDGHTFLKFRYDKYLINADSTTSILQGDLIQAKLNQSLKGLRCENINEESRKEFNMVMHKVYKYIADREPKITQNDIENIESFEEIVMQFVSKTDKLEQIDFREKLDILIQKINSTKMIGIDAYSYLLQLKKILFTPQELEDNIKISIIRNSNEYSANALSVISTRLPNENGEMIINRYMYKPGEQLVPISTEELQANFDNNTMGYIYDDDPKIPGVKI